MALTLADGMREAIANAVDDYINGGTAATLEFQTSGDAEVATLTLQDPAFGASSATGTITLAGTPLSDTNATAGTMAKFVIKRDTTTVITGSVGTSGEDINFAGGVAVDGGDTVQLTSFTITCPAS